MSYKANKTLVFNAQIVKIGDIIPDEMVEMLEKQVDEKTNENGIDRLMRLEAISSDEQIEDSVIEISEMSKSELVKFAKDNGIEINSRDSKGDVLAAIELALEDNE